MHLTKKSLKAFAAKVTGITALRKRLELRTMGRELERQAKVREAEAQSRLEEYNLLLRKREEERAKLPRYMERIMRFPVIDLTPEQFEAMVKAADGIDLKTCPIGTWFACKSLEGAPADIRVVGHVVEGKDLIADQWGAGLSIPERGMNRYRVRFVEAGVAATQT